jgi:hypothetical protein
MEIVFRVRMTMTPIVIIPHALGNLETKSSVAKVSILNCIDLFWGTELTAALSYKHDELSVHSGGGKAYIDFETQAAWITLVTAKSILLTSNKYSTHWIPSRHAGIPRHWVVRLVE